MFCGVEAQLIENNPRKFAHGVEFPGRHDEIAGLRQFQNPHHRVDVIGRVAPVGLGGEVAQNQFLLPSLADGERALDDFFGKEFVLAINRFVIVEDPHGSGRTLAVAVITAGLHARHLGDGVNILRRERGLFRLWKRRGPSEDMRRGRVEKACRRRVQPERLEKMDQPQHLHIQARLPQVGLSRIQIVLRGVMVRRQVKDMGRRMGLHQFRDRPGIAQVDGIAYLAGRFPDSLAADVQMGNGPLRQQLREKRTVLTGRPHDEREFHPPTISISGMGKIICPPEARNSSSRATMPLLKCHGSTR